MPFIRAGRRIERDDRGEEPVVAFAVRARAVIPRIAIADAQVNLVEILVIDDRVPHGAAAARGLPLAFVGPGRVALAREDVVRSEEHTSELQSLMRISYAVFCLKKTN